VNPRLFYRTLYEPLVAKLGPVDAETMFAIIGFGAGGPLNFCTFGRERGEPIGTYVSCELAFYEEQQPSSAGPYELLASCDNELWVRSILSDIGRISMEVSFDDGHTLDISERVNDEGVRPPLQGVLFSEECRTRIEGRSYGVLRVVGITRPELEFA